MNYNQYGGRNSGRLSGIGMLGADAAAMSCSGVFPGYGNSRRNQNQCSVSTGSMKYGQQQYSYQQPTASSRWRQQVGRSCPSPAATMSPQMQSQMMRTTRNPQMQQSACGTAAPNMYNKPYQPIMVNVSAAQLSSAKNTSTLPGREEYSVEGNDNVKYIPLQWEDILGKTGMNGMKVTMMPSGNPDDQNQNRQLKISFGGQQAACGRDGGQGETPLKVVSFQPVSFGRVNRNEQGQSASATQMQATQPSAMTYGGQLSAQQNGGGSGSGRRNSL